MLAACDGSGEHRKRKPVRPRPNTRDTRSQPALTHAGTTLSKQKAYEAQLRDARTSGLVYTLMSGSVRSGEELGTNRSRAVLRQPAYPLKQRDTAVMNSSQHRASMMMVGWKLIPAPLLQFVVLHVVSTFARSLASSWIPFRRCA